MNPVFFNFPESLWPSHNPDYMRRVKDGYDIAEQSSVVICGLARNLGELVEYSFCRLSHIKSLFKSYSDICIYTNDNTDNTLDRLRELRRKYGEFHCDIFEEVLGKPFHGSVTTKSRYSDMAYYRNKYLEMVETVYCGHDYLIVLDTDLQGGYSMDGLANSLSWFKELGATGIASNGLIYRESEGKLTRLSYDALAFRRLNHSTPHNQSEINLLCYHRGEAPIQVNSAFGGLCIYDLRKLLGYNTTYQEYDCDHVTLHDCVTSKGGRIFLNPSQLTLYSKGPYNL